MRQQPIGIRMTSMIAGLLSTYFVSAQVRVHLVHSETYELANVVLALTAYGKADNHQVEKGTPYYHRVVQYFEPWAQHPLLQQVNYSRALWDRFLSFRTDAYAYRFTNEGKLVRSFRFYSMGKDMQEFAAHLALVEDFARQSNFREFYRQQVPLLDSISELFHTNLMIPKMIAFLNQEFGALPKSKLALVFSPLVGGMHCQREVNGVPTSFVDVPAYFFRQLAHDTVSTLDRAIELHMFFTELDHEYVNPETKRYRKLYKTCFIPSLWDTSSGYQEYRYATFNEYMTWAVYDVFVQFYFPLVADQATELWHNVNRNRGFFASEQFAAELLRLYRGRKHGECIKDLYPAMLDWCCRQQGKVKMPDSGHLY